MSYLSLLALAFLLKGLKFGFDARLLFKLLSVRNFFLKPLQLVSHIFYERIVQLQVFAVVVEGFHLLNLVDYCVQVLGPVGGWERRQLFLLFRGRFLVLLGIGILGLGVLSQRVGLEHSEGFPSLDVSTHLPCELVGSVDVFALNLLGLGILNQVLELVHLLVVAGDDAV